MPAPRAPKLTGRPSPHEMKRAGQQIRRAQNWTADRPLRLTQGASGFHVSLDTSGDWFLARLTSVYSITAADVETGGAYQGFAEGTNLYSFTEQVFDPDNGYPIDATAGRQTITNATTEKPSAAFAEEINNALLTVPSTAPPGYTNPGPYVEMRLKGLVAGVPLYEFEVSSASGAWVQVTSTEPQSVLLGGRQFADATLVAGSPTIDSPADANFTSADVGKFVTGSGISQQRTVNDAAFTASSSTVTSVTANFTTNDVGSNFDCPAQSISTTIASWISATQVTLAITPTATATGQTATFGNNTTITAVTPAVPPSTASSATMSQPAYASESPGTVQIGSCFLTVYAGVIDSWVDAGCGFDTGGAVLFHEVNDRVPNTEIYQCRLLDTTVTGVQVWATRFDAPPDCTVTIGPFVTAMGCVNGVPTVSTAFICIPNGNICEAFVCNTTGDCPIPSPPPPPPPPLPPPPPPPPLGDIFFGGSDW